MNRREKELVVRGIESDLTSSNAAFLVCYKGLVVEEMQKLRSGLRVVQGKLQVAKARLVKRAASATTSTDLDPLLKDQIALVFAQQDVVRVAKILHDFSKTNQLLKIVGGKMGTTLLDAQSVSRLAQLPSREVLLGQLLGVMNEPVSSLVRLLNLLIVRLLYVLKEIEKNKQQ